MLDVLDFVEAKGGDPKKILESQRRRYAPEKVIDEIAALFERHRKSLAYCLKMPNTLLNISQPNMLLRRSEIRSM